MKGSSPAAEFLLTPSPLWPVAMENGSVKQHKNVNCETRFILKRVWSIATCDCESWIASKKLWQNLQRWRFIEKSSEFLGLL